MTRIFFWVGGAVLVLGCSTLRASAQGALRADSLFATGRYLAAYEAYSQLRPEDRQLYHLLRMAYIQEGLQQHAKTLYHLMEYYAHTQKQQVWNKVATLSKTQGMGGYELEEEERILLWLLSHKGWLFGLNGSLWLFVVILCFLRRRGRFRRGVGLFVLSLGLLALLERHMWLPQRAVVLENHTGLHAGPSGAAPLYVSVLPPGTLLRVQRRGGLWTKVYWEGRQGYVRTQRLGLLRYD